MSKNYDIPTDGQAREKSFRLMVERQRDLIWHVCSTYRLSAAWQVEDAFHEVLLELWRDFDSFGKRSSERTWVYRVASNTMISIKRRRGNQPTEDADLAEAAVQPDGYPLLAELIEALDEVDYRIVKAHLYGFGYSEIARMTGLTVAAVSMRLTRAKRKLRKLYEDER